LRCLRDFDQPMSTGRVRLLCAGAVLACHDRKVCRDYLVDILKICDGMQETVATLDRTATVTKVVEMLDRGHRIKPDARSLDGAFHLPEALQQKIVEHEKLLCAQRLRLAEVLSYLTECPPEGTPIS